VLDRQFMIDLYLIRHGDAAPAGESGADQDADRPLTEKGEAQAAALAQALRRRGIVLDKVVTSPLVRARQTAEGIVRHLGAGAPGTCVCEDLAPGGRRRRITRFLRDLSGSALAVVGHEPDLSQYAGWLVGSKKAHINLAKGGAACIACGQRPGKASGTLVWLVNGDWLGDEVPGKDRGS
jgi:phosphohistidine phosphatase